MPRLLGLSCCLLFLSACSDGGEPNESTGGSGGVAAGGGVSSGGANPGVGGGSPSVGGSSSGGQVSAVGGASGGSGGSSSGGTTSGGAASGGATGGTASGGAAQVGGTGGMEPEPIPEHIIPEDPCAPRLNYRNLFWEILGKTKAEVQEKLDASYEHFFNGGDQERIYYESGSDEAYILDVNNNDVRSEGMSYGMMVAVQMDKQTQFDRLWKWAKAHTQQSNGYFSWQTSPNGNVISTAIAPDGEEYFATALIFAAHRWGSGGHDYVSDAQNLLNALRHNGAFNTNPPIVRFGVTGTGASHTDPSYVLPSFYEVWACFDETNRSFWQGAITTARDYFHNATHPQTGLAPYKSYYDGGAYPGASNFNVDSWRVVGNIMMDHHWFEADPWQVDFAERYGAFFESTWATRPNADEFSLDGGVAHESSGRPKGLVAQNALIAFAASESLSLAALEDFWDMEIPDGQYRYYDGMLYLFAMLHASGNYRLY